MLNYQRVKPMQKTMKSHSLNQCVCKYATKKAMASKNGYTLVIHWYTPHVQTHNWVSYGFIGMLWPIFQLSLVTATCHATCHADVKTCQECLQTFSVGGGQSTLVLWKWLWNQLLGAVRAEVINGYNHV